MRVLSLQPFCFLGVAFRLIKVLLRENGGFETTESSLKVFPRTGGRAFCGDTVRGGQRGGGAHWEGVASLVGEGSLRSWGRGERLQVLA